MFCYYAQVALLLYVHCTRLAVALKYGYQSNGDYAKVREAPFKNIETWKSWLPFPSKLERTANL